MNDDPKISIWTLSCREASRLTSEAADRALTRRERLGLGLHKLLCGPCRRFAAQTAAMRQIVVAMPEHIRLKLSETSLSAERRDAIKRLLADEMKKELLG